MYNISSNLDIFMWINQSINFPGEIRKDPKGYYYYLPASIFEVGKLSLPFKVWQKLETSGMELAKFASYFDRIVDPSLFVYLYSRNEATLSSRIEGTRTGVEDIFINNESVDPEKRDDQAEVSAYINAQEFAFDANLPLSSRLICEAHSILLNQVRGKHKRPGQYRVSQNWVGGSQLDNALFIPPPHHYVHDLMNDLEKFIHDQHSEIPHLIKIAAIHLQFESIHPFLDGNGRLGRMLITMYLLEKKILTKPMLYPSKFFEKNRTAYYEALDYARSSKEGYYNWILFFLDALEETAKDGIKVTDNLINYLTELREQKIPQSFGRQTPRALKLLDYMVRNIVISAPVIQDELKFSPRASYSLINRYLELGVIADISGHNRNRIFIFNDYIKILKGE